MARKAAVGLLGLAITLGLVGCTWTETQHDYPPSLERAAAGHAHGHSHGHVHGE